MNHIPEYIQLPELTRQSANGDGKYIRLDERIPIGNRPQSNVFLRRENELPDRTANNTADRTNSNGSGSGSGDNGNGNGYSETRTDRSQAIIYVFVVLALFAGFSFYLYKKG